MEQLKGIRKELGMESDGKDKLIEKFKERAASLKLQGFGGEVLSPSSSCLLYLCAKRFLFCQIKAFISPSAAQDLFFFKTCRGIADGI